MFSLIIFSIVLCLANSSPTDDPYVTEAVYDQVTDQNYDQPMTTPTNDLKVTYDSQVTEETHEPYVTPYEPQEIGSTHYTQSTEPANENPEIVATHKPNVTMETYEPRENSSTQDTQEIGWLSDDSRMAPNVAEHEPQIMVGSYEPQEKVSTLYAKEAAHEPQVITIEAKYAPQVTESANYDTTTTELPQTNHKLTASRDDRLLAKAITAKIVGPVVIFNSKVAAAAGALPSLLAAKGAIIGSAIATPIEIGAVAGSSLVSGVTGKLVAVPIAAVSGAKTKFVGAAQRGQQIWDFNREHGKEILKDGFIKIGHIILKPIAVVVGAHTALTGAGLGIAGSGIKGVGVGIEKVGGKMLTAGLIAKGLGHKLIKAQFVP